MIRADMRYYDYYTFGEANEYGQPALSEDIKGSILMAINTINTTTTTDIRYKDSNYIGLTNATVNDSFVIKYGNERLKVLYVVPKGRYTQVFLKNI